VKVCNNCIGESVIEERIRNEGKKRKCSFCNEIGITVTIEELASFIDPIFRVHYGIGPDVPVFDDDSDKVFYEQKGDDLDEIISEILICDGDIASEIASSLISNEDCDPRDGGECLYSDTDHYAEMEYYGDVFGASWISFRHDIKHQRRFFLEAISSELDEIFAELNSHKTLDGKGPIVTISPSEQEGSFYRGRIAGSDNELSHILLNPHAELGPPPANQARAGRMNPAGIPVFYGAYDRQTCIVELRPPAGSKVVTGEFRLCKPITVLDLTVFDMEMVLPSVFADPLRSIRQHQQFMSDLHDEISRPILPSDESISYIPTQVVAEYLASKFNISGIVYRSSQSSIGGKNIVIFNNSCKCKKSYVHVRYDIRAMHEDYYIKYLYDISDTGVSEYRYVVPSGYDDEACGIEFVLESEKIHHVASYVAKTKDFIVHTTRQSPGEQANEDF